MAKKDHNEIDFQKPYKSTLSTSKLLFYMALFSGVAIFVIDVFLTLSNNISSGITSSNEIGQGGGQHTFINGPGAIALGLIILVPLLLFRRSK